MKTPGTLGLCAALLLGGHLTAGAQQPQADRVPGTTVRLVPPEGFTAARQFPGFQRDDLQTSIAVTEMPGSASAMASGMTKQALADQGITLIASKPMTVGGRNALLLHLAQRVGETDYLKWMLLSGDENTTTLIVGTFPRSAESAVSAAVQASLLTASWSAEAADDPLEGLLFRITPTSRLKLAQRMSNMILLTESGTVARLGPGDPLYIVGNSISSAGIDNLQAFAEARARQTAQMKDVRNFKGQAVKVDGLDGYELVADAKDARTGTPMTLYQVIVPDVTGYFIVQGLISAGRAEELLPEFRQITATFRRTTPETVKENATSSSSGPPFERPSSSVRDSQPSRIPRHPVSLRRHARR